jgi:putative inorganic carbon (HCO3(-)) transporter
MGNWHALLDVDKLKGRPGIWSQALDAIRQFPLTGVGLGAFRQVAHLFGPVTPSQPDVDIAHAHNVFLQVGVDLGIPGLVGYVALIGAALWCCVQTSQVNESRFGWLATGIASALLGFHVYGLTDTIALGAKPGVVFWLLLGLAVGAWQVDGAQDREPPAPVEAERA